MDNLLSAAGSGVTLATRPLRKLDLQSRISSPFRGRSTVCLVPEALSRPALLRHSQPRLLMSSILAGLWWLPQVNLIPAIEEPRAILERFGPRQTQPSQSLGLMTPRSSN